MIYEVDQLPTVQLLNNTKNRYVFRIVYKNRGLLYVTKLETASKRSWNGTFNELKHAARLQNQTKQCKRRGSLSVQFKQRFNEEFFTGHKRRCCISKRSDFALIDLSLGRFRRVHISIAFRALIVPGRWCVR